MLFKDNLAWTQVSDLKFWDNAVAKLYGIQAIPQKLFVRPARKNHCGKYSWRCVKQQTERDFCELNLQA
jgi:hypothetical protein